MKILLTGTMFVGKSTTLNALKKRRPQCVSFISEVARELLEQKPELEKDPNFQDILFLEQVQREVSAEKSISPIVICDRGSVDIIAHSLLFGHPVKKEWIDWSHSYDIILHFRKDDVPFTNELFQADSLFSSDRDWVEFRDKLETCFLNTYDAYSLETKVLQGNLEERVLYLENEINNLNSFVECIRRTKES